MMMELVALSRWSFAENPSPPAIETVTTNPEEIAGSQHPGSAPTPPTSTLPPLMMLFFNLLIVIALAIALRSLVVDLLPCISPAVSAPSLAVILLMVFHLVWRFLLDPVIARSGDTVDLKWIAVPVQVVASLINALHPWILSDAKLWAGTLSLCLVAAVLNTYPLSPIAPKSEETPIVRSFTVQYLERDELVIPMKPGDVVEIKANERVLVQTGALEQEGVICTWSARNGHLERAKGCATLYTAPFRGDDDVLDIQAQSPCKTQCASASLHIKVTVTD